MLIGYARVSTQDQNLELQQDSLAKAGCQKIFEDKLSGTRAERPGLGKALEMLRENDTLVVWKLDRLGRSVKQLVDLVGDSTPTIILLKKRPSLCVATGPCSMSLLNSEQRHSARLPLNDADLLWSMSHLK